MSTYARIASGVVMELFTSSAPIATLFPPAMIWVDVTATPAVQAGWVQIPGGGFQSPTAQTPTAPPITLAAIQAQLAALQSQVNQLIAAGAH